MRKSLAAQRAVGVQTEEIDRADVAADVAVRRPVAVRRVRLGSRAAATATRIRPRRPSRRRHARPASGSARGQRHRTAGRRRRRRGHPAGRRRQGLGGHRRRRHRGVDRTRSWRPTASTCPSAWSASRSSRSTPASRWAACRCSPIWCRCSTSARARRRHPVRQQRSVRRRGSRPRRLPQPRHRGVRRPHRRQGGHQVSRLHRRGDPGQLCGVLRRHTRLEPGDRHGPTSTDLFVAAGFSGHGFKIAPAVGRLVADLVDRRPQRRPPHSRRPTSGCPGSLKTTCCRRRIRTSAPGRCARQVSGMS